MTKKVFPFVSVVINFFNEAENIHMAPLSLSKQTYSNFEVVLVDDGSTDGTANLLLNSYEHLLPKLKMFYNKKRLGLRPARNLGVRNSSGDIIITLDMHVTFDSDFIKRIVDVFIENPNLGAVGSLILPIESKWYSRGMSTLSLIIFSIRKKMKKYTWVNGGSAAYRTKALEEISYLSENELAEDVDASWQLTKKGWDVIILENNIVLHKSSYNSFKGFLKIMFLGGIRTTYLLSRHKKQILYPQSLFKLFFFPLIFFLLFLSPVVFMISSFLYLLFSTLILFLFTKKGVKNSIIAALLSIVVISLPSLGMIYCLFAKFFGKKIGI